MARNEITRDDGGYGAGNLVGSSESGLRSAIEARESVERAARGDASHDAPTQDASLGHLADTAPGRRVDGPNSSAGLGATLDQNDDSASNGDRGGLKGLED